MAVEINQRLGPTFELELILVTFAPVVQEFVPRLEIDEVKVVVSINFFCLP